MTKHTFGIPILILWGKEDRWIPAEKGEMLHSMIPGSKPQIIPNSGHLVIKEVAYELLEAILTFVENCLD